MQLSAWVLVTACVLGSDGGDTPLKLYHSQDFGFKAELPGDPKVATIRLTLQDGTEVPAKEFSVQDGDATYRVVITKWKGQVDAYPVLYTSMQGDVLRRFGHRVVDSRAFKYDFVREGRDIVTTKGDDSEFVRGRLMYMWPYGYRFLVTGPKASIDSEKAKRFLETATLLAGASTLEPEFTQVILPAGAMPPRAGGVSTPSPTPAPAPAASRPRVMTKGQPEPSEPAPAPAASRPRVMTKGQPEPSELGTDAPRPRAMTRGQVDSAGAAGAAAAAAAAAAPEPSPAPNRVSTTRRKRSAAPQLSDIVVTPTTPGTPIDTQRWRADDLDVTSLKFAEKDILPCPVWSPEGRSFFLLSANDGILRRVTTSGRVEAARLEIGQPCSWLAPSSGGLLVVLPNLQEVWQINPANLALVRKFAAPGVTRVVSSLRSRYAFATPQPRNGLGCGRVEVLDLTKGKSAGSFESSGFDSGFAYANLSPDGRYLFGVAPGEMICRFRVSPTGDVQFDAAGPRIGQNPQDLVISDDGNLIALPSGGGNYVPNDLHPPQKYGTYLYKPTNLDRPVSVIESGAYPRAIGFDTKNGRVLTQGGEFDLIVFKTGGSRVHAYHLASRNVRVRVGTPIRFAVHPQGGKFLMATSEGIFVVEPAAGAATADEPAEETAPAPRTRRSRTRANTSPKVRRRTDDQGVQ